jgi:NAD(P)-dependent dehydrogenase (short-subunit alcohol dehydrogenase family)
MGIEQYRYDGRRALVVGGATGMGAATAKAIANLGGEVIVMDVADITYPCKQAIQVDLTRKDSVDAAVDQVEGSLDAVFCCAGVADGTPNLMLINFIAQRHLLDCLLARDALPRGSAIAMISSVAGMGWQQDLATVLDFLSNEDWEAASAWIERAGDKDTYIFSKQAMNGYVAKQALPLMKRGIRINAIEPGPTDTPLARANAEVWLGYSADYNKTAGIETLTPDQMANVLAFLCSQAASGMSGVSFLVDHGLVNATVTGAYAPPEAGRA